ncbi:kelch-like protein 33 [Sarotherodon galilaeus]
MWPPNKVDVVKATKRPGGGWKTYKVQVIFTSSDYNEARLKLPKAVEHTDLRTDREDSPIKPKRRRIPCVSQPQPERPCISHVSQPQPERLFISQPQPERLFIPHPQPERPCVSQPQPERPFISQPQPERLFIPHPQPERPCVSQPQPERPNILTNQEMIMDQIKILFTTVQGLKTVTEEEIGVEPNLLPLADRQAVENLEERLRNSPDLKNQLGCVLSPILYTLYTHNCVTSKRDNTILKFADDTAVIGHITGGTQWLIGKRTLNTTQLVKKAQQRLYFLRRLRKFGMLAKILSRFYSCIVKSTLTSCITAWYGSTTAMEHKRLQRVITTAEKIIRTPLACLQSIYHRRVQRRAASILKDPTHPQHGLFTLLPSRRTLRSVKSRISRLNNSFFPNVQSPMSRYGY